MQNGDNEVQQFRDRQAKSDAKLKEYRRTIDELLSHVQALSTRLEALELWRSSGPMQGLHVAKVAGGDSGTPAAIDPQGRVNIEMNWDSSQSKPSKLKAKVSRDWLTASGGGNQFLPRVGQNVFVAFLQGDPEMPVVVGYLASSENPLPYPPGDQSSQNADDTSKKSPTLAATEKVPSGFPEKAKLSDYNPSTDDLAKAVIRSSNYGSTATKASEIAFVDQLDSEALTMATQGELRQYSKGDHYFRSEGDSTQVVGGDYNLAVLKNTNISLQKDYTQRYGGKVDTEVIGDWFERHLQDSQTILYGDYVSLFMGAWEQVFLGQRTDLTLGILPYLKITLGLEFNCRIGAVTLVNIGPVAKYALKSKEYILGTHERVVVGSQTTTVVGSRNNGVLGVNQDNALVDSRSNSVSSNQSDVRNDDLLLSVENKDVQSKQTDLSNQVSGLLLLDSGGDEDEPEPPQIIPDDEDEQPPVPVDDIQDAGNDSEDGILEEEEESDDEAEQDGGLQDGGQQGGDDAEQDGGLQGGGQEGGGQEGGGQEGGGQEGGGQQGGDDDGGQDAGQQDGGQQGGGQQGGGQQGGNNEEQDGGLQDGGLQDGGQQDGGQQGGGQQGGGNQPDSNQSG